MLNTESAVYSTSAEILAAIANVDILIDETFIGPNLTDFMTNYGIAEADQSKYKFLVNKKVFREDGILTASGGYDWFEAPVAMADAFLEDMINAINSNAPTPEYNRNWLRNIALGEQIKYSTPDNCTWSESAPRPDLATQFNGSAFTLAAEAKSAANTVIPTNIIGAFIMSLASLVYLA